MTKREDARQFIELGDGSRWYADRTDQEHYAPVVAASLSKLCRFTGHCSVFYSVAEHSVKASYMVTPEFALEALLHDAHESICNDLSKPVKIHIGGSYADLEAQVELESRKSFGLTPHISAEVKLADDYMVCIEAHYLLSSGGKQWEHYDNIREMAIDASRTNPYFQPSGWLPERGYEEFMRRFNELTQK